MNVNWDNTPSMDTQQIRIVTIDPATARVEGVMKDGAMIQVAVWDTPLIFRWPQEGETWNICRQGVYWYLDSLVEDPNDVMSNAELQPGETKISASKVYDREGAAFLTSRGVQAARMAVSLGSGASSTITIPWPVPFADTNYTATVATQDASGGNTGLKLSRIVGQAVDAIQVRVVNDSAGAVLGTVHAIGVTDTST